jgi:curved DNA-binding protein CbpA
VQQNAYEVLSDAHERAWYDSHRESILRGGDGRGGGARGASSGAGDDGSDDDDDEHRETGGINLWAYFRPSAYANMGDGDQGFFGVFGKLFADLSAHEMNRAKEDGVPCRSAPAFGASTASAEVFTKFYQYWENFVTKQSFSWKDRYRLSDAPDRKIRRLMEQDNEKAREKAKKNYIDTVRVRTRTKTMPKPNPPKYRLTLSFDSFCPIIIFSPATRQRRQEARSARARVQRAQAEAGRRSTARARGGSCYRRHCCLYVCCSR